MIHKLFIAIYNWIDKHQTDRLINRLKKIQEEEERTIPSFRGSIYLAINKLAPYISWNIGSNRYPDYCKVVNTVNMIFGYAYTLTGKVRLLDIEYTGVKDAGVKVWMWQMKKPLSVTMTYTTPMLLLLINSNQVKITYFFGKGLTYNEWWKQKEVENASWNDIVESMKWIDTYQNN